MINLGRSCCRFGGVRWGIDSHRVAGFWIFWNKLIDRDKEYASRDFSGVSCVVGDSLFSSVKPSVSLVNPKDPQPKNRDYQTADDNENYQPDLSGQSLWEIIRAWCRRSGLIVG